MRLFFEFVLFNIIFCEKKCSGPKWKCRYDDLECRNNQNVRYKKFECDEGKVKT